MADTYNAMLRDVQAIVRSANCDIHSDFNACMFRDGCRKQADEIAQLRQYLDAAQRRGEELRAQVAALEGDAGRYRWLALQRVTPEHWGGRWSIVIEGPAPQSWPRKDQFDAAIDAALAARKGG